MELRAYQKEDVNYLLTQPAMGCFNEQRTGKTPTAIAVMEARDINKLLIITTASAVHQWKAEYERWTNKKATILEGTKKKKQKLVATWTEGAVITSYDSFKSTTRSDGLVDLILKQNPEAIIADEIHKIKNHKTSTAKALFKCIKIPYRLALTGTPAPNRAHDIWSILHFICPNVFTSFWKFVETYCDISVKYNHQGKPFKDIGPIKPELESCFQRILADLSTQRKRSEVMQWLPEKEYVNIMLTPTTDQKKYLHELTEYFETGSVVVQGVLDRLIRCRQVCLHPGLLGLKGNSPKLDWTLQYLKDYPEVPTLLFTKFTSFIQLLRPILKKNDIKFASITGATPSKLRKQYVDDFQKGKYNLLILNIDAGKEALTLDRAEAVIFTDKYPPVADIAQAEDRFIATTQQRANKGHIVYNLIMEDTYDEQIYKLIEQHASEVDIINNYKKYIKEMKE